MLKIYKLQRLNLLERKLPKLSVSLSKDTITMTSCGKFLYPMALNPNSYNTCPANTKFTLDKETTPP